MRPHVICHMMSSLDGKTDPHTLKYFGDISIFESTHDHLGADAWLCGRVTLQVDFGEFAEPEPFHNDGEDPVGEDEVHIAKKAESYAVAADTHGQILWKGSDIDGDKVIAIVSRQASKRYLELLRNRHVSYIVAGVSQIDFNQAFEMLASHFGIKTLIVEGGGNINGAVLEAGLIDELSLLLMPGVDGRRGPSASLDGRNASPVSGYPAKLQSIDRLDNEVLWLRYLLGSRVE